MGTTLNSNQCQPFGTKNQLAPSHDEGPKAVPIRLDFGAAVQPAVSPVFVDLTPLSDSKRFTLLQGVYIDNSNNASSFSITVGDQLAQTITCPASAQGYFPILCTMPIRLNFITAGNGVVTVDLLNFPVACAVWKV